MNETNALIFNARLLKEINSRTLLLKVFFQHIALVLVLESLTLTMNNYSASRFSDVATTMIVVLVIAGAMFLGYYVAMVHRDQAAATVKRSSTQTTTQPSGLSSQYGTGITAAPNNLTADNYTAPTAWARVGIIKTEDPNEDTFYPLFERRLSPQYDIFQYAVVATDRNNTLLPLPDSKFLETNTNIGVIKGLESKGNWIVERIRMLNWAYT